MDCSNFVVVQVGDRIIGRWTNNVYYPGKVSDVSSFTYTILFDNGNKTTHSIGDNSAVIDDKCPQEMIAGQHVVGKRKWKRGIYSNNLTNSTSGLFTTNV